MHGSCTVVHLLLSILWSRGEAETRARMSTLQRKELLTQSEILEKETLPPAKEAHQHFITNTSGKGSPRNGPRRAHMPPRFDCVPQFRVAVRAGLPGLSRTLASTPTMCLRTTIRRERDTGSWPASSQSN